MMNARDADPRHERLAALLIGAAALLEVVLATHHPMALATKGTAPLGGIAAVAESNLAFHAVLMIVLVGQSVGLVLLARLLGLTRPLVLAGLLLCGLAGVMLAVAMTFDGFVTHDLIASCSASPPGCAASLRLVWAVTSAFSQIGFGAQCLGLAALSAGLWVPGKRVRLLGVAGAILALAPTALVLPAGRIGPGRLLEVLAFLAASGLCLAAALGRGMVSRRLIEPRRGERRIPAAAQPLSDDAVNR